MQTRLRWILGAVVGFAALVGLWSSIASAVSGGSEPHPDDGEGQVECLAIDCVDGSTTTSEFVSGQATTTVPSTTVPPTTVPSTTVPSTTAPPTTVPPTTVPDPNPPDTTGDPDELPATGASSRWLATLAATLIAAGVVILGLERRRAFPVATPIVVSRPENQRRR